MIDYRDLIEYPRWQDENDGLPIIKTSSGGSSYPCNCVRFPCNCNDTGVSADAPKRPYKKTSIPVIQSSKKADKKPVLVIPKQTTSDNLIDKGVNFAKENPLLVLGGLGLLAYLGSKKK